MMELWQAVKKFRGSRSQAELGEYLGVRNQTVSDWERGRGDPDFQYLWRMARECGDGEQHRAFAEAAAAQVKVPVEELAAGLGTNNASGTITAGAIGADDGRSNIHCRDADRPAVQVIADMLARPRSEVERTIVEFIWGLAEDRGARRKTA